MQQGVRFDPDMPQTIRLEFAKSNTKVSKPKQPAAAAATSHPALMHPLTGRKYAPPLVHSLDTSHYYSHPLHRTTTYLPPCCFSISFSLLLPPPPVILERIFLLFLSSFFFFYFFFFVRRSCPPTPHVLEFEPLMTFGNRGIGQRGYSTIN